MKYLLCPDKFKGTLTASEVCAGLAEGISSIQPDAEIRSIPMADGGDGSISLLIDRLGLRRKAVDTVDPLGREIRAAYYSTGSEAYVELAAASGLVLLEDDERDPLKTSTFGTGLVIREAIANGCDKVNLFIGGSATNDAATGIASALGYRFLDVHGNQLAPIGADLLSMEQIQYDSSAGLRGLATFNVICDVDNPFFGPKGAAHVYAAQKGASDGTIATLDKGLIHFAALLKDHGYADLGEVPGAGAAGGVGGGMLALFDAQLVSGVSLFFDLFNVPDAIAVADLIITGEGKFDDQSFDGKVVGRICDACAAQQKGCIVICGMNEVTLSPKSIAGLQDTYVLVDLAESRQKALKEAYTYIVGIGTEIAAKAASDHA